MGWEKAQAGKRGVPPPNTFMTDGREARSRAEHQGAPGGRCQEVRTFPCATTQAEGEERPSTLWQFFHLPFQKRDMGPIFPPTSALNFTYVSKTHS